MTPPKKSTPPENSFAAFLRRNRFLILGVGGLVLVWMLVYALVAYRPVYASKAVVIIKDSAITNRYVETEQYYAQQTTSSSSSNPVLNTMSLLKSATISDAVYAYFLAKHPEELQRNKISKQDDWNKFFGDGSAFIKAKNQPGTDLIAIQFSWRDKVIAREALSAVVKAFQDASRDLNQEEQISRTKFLQAQVREIEEQLAAIRKEKSEYQSKEGTVSVQREGSDLAGTRLELANRLNKLESEAHGKEEASRRYQQMLGMGPETALAATALGQNGTLSKLQDELYRLEQQYSLLSASLTDANPKVQEVQAQIEQVKANIAAEKSRTMGKLGIGGKTAAGGSVVADSNRAKLVDNMLTAQAEAQELRTQAASVRTRLAQVDTQLKNFPWIAEGLTNIEQKENSLSLALDNLRKKALEGKLKEEQTLSNVFIVDAPRLPERPQFPTQLHLLALSVALGAGAGLAAAFAKEQFFAGQRELPDWMEPLEEQPEPAMENAPSATPTLQEPPVSVPVIVQPEHLAVAAQSPAGTMTAPSSANQAPTDAVPSPETAVRSASLLDDIIPVAGPMARNGKYPQSKALRPKAAEAGETPIRRDLLQALPAPAPAEPAPSPVTPVESRISASGSAAAPVTSNARSNAINEADLLPPGTEAPQEQTLPAATSAIAAHTEAAAQDKVEATASRVRQSTPNDPMLLDRLRQAQRSAVSTRGIPTLHAAPPAAVSIPMKPASQPAAAATAIHSATEATPVETRRPIRQPLPLTQASERHPATENRPTAETRKPEVVSPDDDHEEPDWKIGGEKRLTVEEMVNLVQESFQQPSAPPSRRGVPAFLLDDRKQVLSEGDDLFADVAPMSAPVDEETLAWQRPNHAPDDERRSPLKISALWFRKQPSRHPEAYFGMDRRGNGAEPNYRRGNGAEADRRRRKDGAPLTGPYAG